MVPNNPNAAEVVNNLVLSAGSFSRRWVFLVIRHRAEIILDQDGPRVVADGWPPGQDGIDLAANGLRPRGADRENQQNGHAQIERNTLRKGHF